jgi:hypothetical protein
LKCFFGEYTVSCYSQIYPHEMQRFERQNCFRCKQK